MGTRDTAGESCYGARMPGPEEHWRHSLQLQRGHLRQLEEDGRSSPKAVSDARRRVERIWEQGLPEWRRKGRHDRLPLPEPVEKPQ
jgi:hypothetical protein